MNGRRTSLTADDAGVSLGTGRGASVTEVVAAARRITGHPIPAVHGPRRPGGADSAITYADPSRAHHLLGWRATRTLDDMIASAWAWRQRHPHGYQGKGARSSTVHHDAR
jgi:UDP-glucose 4-epimerase